RNGDANPETVRYAWSGIPGDPLTRSYNGGAPVNVAVGVNAFALTYTSHTVSTTTTQNVVSTSAETTLASFNGWLLVLIPTAATYTVSTTSWIGESFAISPPANCTKVNFTRCQLKLRTSASS